MADAPHCKICRRPMTVTETDHCQCESTAKQQKSVRHYLRRFPDTVRPLLANRRIEDLNKSEISFIIGTVKTTHGLPDYRRQDDGQQRQQHHDEQEQRQQDDEHDNRQDDREEKQVPKTRTRTGYRPGSKQDILARALHANNLDIERTMRILSETDRIGTGPLTFTRNPEPHEDGRQALDLGTLDDDTQQDTQHGRARKTLYAVRRDLIRRGIEQDDDEPEEKQEKEEKRQEKPKIEQIGDYDRTSQQNAEEMIRWIQADLRPIAHRRGPDGRTLDEIGLRPAEYAARMLRQGISPAAIKHALTMHYPSEHRRALGVTDYDVTTFAPLNFGKVNPPADALKHDGKHRAMGYVQALLSARIPAALVGPKGTGKTTLAKQAAEMLGVPFGFISMTAGTSPSMFEGRQKIGGDGGFFTSQFEQIFAGGGVYLFDEMDAAEPNLILLVNAALANGYFVNAKNEIVERHPDFMPMAGMNTLGLGNDANYVGRDKQDAAALDRWNAGRVKVELDEKLERKIFWSICAA